MGLGHEYFERLEIGCLTLRKCQLLPFLGDQKHYIRQKSRSFAYWGLSFKPGTDDVREAPAFYVIKTLLKQEAQAFLFSIR